MKHLLASASVLALATLPRAAIAQDDAFDLGTITVSASQTPVETSRTGTVVEIVDQETIENSTSIRVADTLDTLPGISLSGNGGLGTASTLRIRGLPARYVPVYIDGIDMTDPSGTQTSFGFGPLTTAGIGSIEVLKGSQSALYGSEAIGGVINISTLRATENGTQLRYNFEAGSYNTFASSFGVATKSDRGELAFTISHVSTDGFSAADENDGNTEADGYKGTTLILTGAYQATEQVKLGFALNYIDSETDQDGFPAPAFTLTDTANQEFATRLGARIYAEIESGAVDHTLSLAYSEINRDYPVGTTNAFSGERTELSYKGVTQAGAVDLAFGASYSEEKFAADAVTGTYRIASVFGEAQYAVSNDIDLSFALRHDDHSTFGGFTTGRLAANWRVSANTTLRAAIGTGFRAPSLYELFGPFGSPTLEQEESRSAEFGVEHRFVNNAVVKATVFYTEIDNLIDFAGAGYTQVPGTSTSKGVELSGRVALGAGTDLFGSYTFTDATGANGAQLVRVPKHDFVLGVEADLTDKLSGQLVVNHVAGRANESDFSTFPATPVPMADYTVINASATYDFSDTTQGYMRLENLTNEQYQTSLGYGTSDRAVYFGVRASF
ncbi:MULTISPECIES: TonB-dependent receptor plug domain-containing protein [Roseobacteraceae]|jgi:vitamin B12 transporter|uniref:Vitamin B12 transporter BtuB n=1 Tax=Pseudosulfitobacter pseudonitzschiae TaxID=1402135 RepID=A0A221JYK7_9RHOB|nr:MULTISPECIES: TonB-dependent receptor [Roseobacteraceae]ASM71814.1 vitamin B12 transporter BtuB [Pseudosulfitobacter pseudonitzschiae]